MAPDLRNNATYPRRGREEFAGFLWLLRIADKGRAAAAGTLGEYVYPCPIDRGMLSRWKVSRADFDAALGNCASDESLAAWLGDRVDVERRARANAWLLRAKSAFMNRQDYDEQVPGTPKPPVFPYDILRDVLFAG